MKTYISILPIFFLNLFSYAQVGINTENPKATLDIKSSDPDDPSNSDGILIPRISKFPSEDPNDEQNGMMVYLDTDISDFSKGFYFWNAEESSWLPIKGNSSEANFYEVDTETSPEDIESSIYREGNIGIGTDDIESKLQIDIIPDRDDDIKKGLEIDNQNSEENTRTTYGAEITNRSATNGVKYGIKSNVNGTGAGIHYGIFNETFQSTGTNDIYGIFNRVGRTYGANSNNFGLYSEIGSSTAQGNIYAIYGTAQGNSTADVFAGYFAGRLGIGLNPSSEYIFPSERANEDMVLALSEDGLMRWRPPTYYPYFSSTSSTGTFVIEEHLGSLRINNNLSAVQVPDASENRGRTIILVCWSTTSDKALSFVNGDDLFDVTTNSSITNIESGTVLTILSAGNRWLVINKYTE
ncbi:hypothetical protein [Zunongwangia atlantica]|uniref:Uncharacterized protein n=1 Tax=Zunongwangia atlantica 22II14-10F7 TaxID=1185767 RepID=A0A1Y1T0A5_9FLAO|nr:hypothetical protein [Zunongwangia atlantica]ORL44439.1 hypothetical protein IIF7_15690 [Zunongwangia atlantica 22II14-10F7]